MSERLVAYRQVEVLKRPRWILTLAIVPVVAIVSACVDAAPAEEQAAKAATPTAVVDPDATIRAQINADWKQPERGIWRIAYHPIKGLEDKSAWHVAGTIWSVRLNSPVYKLDDLDKQAVYEIDAVALDQNYGVIDFYVYSVPKKVANESK